MSNQKPGKREGRERKAKGRDSRNQSGKNDSKNIFPALTFSSLSLPSFFPCSSLVLPFISEKYR
jgi:hypothetical protein